MSQPVHLFIEHLTVMDFSYLHPTRGIVGESWIVDIELMGDLDAQGMVMDFGHVKKRLKKAIDETLDHALLVPSHMQGLVWDAPNKAFTFTSNEGWFIRHSAPQQATCIIKSTEVSLESVTMHVHDLFKQVVPANVGTVNVTLRPENIEGAYYHYSHGLKKHEGNCQRIAHGHRSQIHVIDSGKRSSELEAYIAELWADSYVVTEEDVTQRFVEQEVEYLTVAYDAPQGEFQLTLPSSHCQFMHSDSTVEHIAQHLAELCAQQVPNQKVTVRAFEGVQKGAIAQS